MRTDLQAKKRYPIKMKRWLLCLTLINSPENPHEGELCPPNARKFHLELQYTWNPEKEIRRKMLFIFSDTHKATC